MSALGHNESEVVAKAKVDDAAFVFSPVEKELGRGSVDAGRRTSIIPEDHDENENISDEDLHNLRRVSGKIPWQAYTIAFCELCERFSYYGCTVVYVNFIQQPLPEGSTTGSDDTQPGALGMGQRASTGLTTFNQVPLSPIHYTRSS